MPPKQPFLLKTLIVILLMLISTISNAVITAPANSTGSCTIPGLIQPGLIQESI